MPAIINKTLNKKHRRYVPMSEINVTPFVDVMLVLLVIFMVTAPLMTVGVEVDLPDASARNISTPVEPLVISITEKGHIFIQETRVPERELVAKLKAITGGKFDAPLFLRGDQKLNYGRIMAIMGRLNQAGFQKLSLIAETP